MKTPTGSDFVFLNESHFSLDQNVLSNFLKLSSPGVVISFKPSIFIPKTWFLVIVLMASHLSWYFRLYLLALGQLDDFSSASKTSRALARMFLSSNMGFPIRVQWRNREEL